MSAPAERLEYLRGEIRAERISMSELAELADLIPHIEPGDLELLEAAGVPELEATGRGEGRPLNEIMEFDHVIEVHANGAITDGPKGVYAPELWDDELSPSHAWELLNGYSGQDRYSGPIMHPSEFIGGGLEDDIRSNPGVYVVVVANYNWTPEEPLEERDDWDSVGGWAVARRVAS